MHVSASAIREQSRGVFQVISSFAIHRLNEFYLVVKPMKGEAHEGWYAHVFLNDSLTLLVKIKRIEYALIRGSEEKKKEFPVFVIEAKYEELDLLLDMNIDSESVVISTENQKV